jgi:hypothetical protein
MGRCRPAPSTWPGSMSEARDVLDALGQHLHGRCWGCRLRLGQCMCGLAEPSTAAQGADGPRYDHEPDHGLERTGRLSVRYGLPSPLLTLTPNRPAPSDIYDRLGVMRHLKPHQVAHLRRHDTRNDECPLCDAPYHGPASPRSCIENRRAKVRGIVKGNT